ncbi:ParB N-terminal domain-containing protein [Kribbella sp. NBC_01505]|uniref:ParB/RepB/Spo0J family partition protein n=1 Tax=Kribbella sp. NBC_01505 TaxID=2903580 RepID=UPI003868CA3D
MSNGQSIFSTRSSEQADEPNAATVPLDVLRPALSPRLDGVNEEHAQLLAESGDALAPIVVQRHSMRIIDGMHRFRAAEIRRQQTVRVEYVDDDDDAAFLRAVAANIGHGLALTLADRKAAALRIFGMYPDWSDRAVAGAVGLSARTVGALRLTDDEAVRVTARRGQDGRVRPLSAATGRQRARDFILNRPHAPLREIASAVGISPATVLDVRNRLRRGEDPVPERSGPTHDLDGAPAGAAGSPGSDAEDDTKELLDQLRRDPSLRYSQAGRTLLVCLNTYPVAAKGDDLIRAVPTHCLARIAQLSRQNALVWQRFAELAERHTNSMDNSR